MHRCLSVVAPVVVSVVALVAGCKDNKPQGLAPASDWGADQNGAAAPAPGGGPAAAAPHMGGGGGGANPHAGIDMGGGGGDPDPSNPHAGIDMGGGAGGADVTKMGLPPPDPNRAIDPSHHVVGVIKIHPKAKDHVKDGGAVFVVVKKADATGQPSGPPVAVEKLTWKGDEIPFELTEAQAMIAGTQLTGDVVVIARFDQDGDAISKQPGDVTGQLRVTIPAEKVVLFLDTLLP